MYGRMTAGVAHIYSFRCHANAGLGTRLWYKVWYKVVGIRLVQGCWHPFGTRFELALAVQGLVQGSKVGAGCKRFSQAPIYIYIYIYIYIGV